MSTTYEVGEYDVMIQGGGPPGILEAVRQRRSGKKVILIESRSCLLWQIARAKQGEVRIDAETSNPVLLSFMDFLEKFKAIRDGKLEPSYTEIAADQWLILQGVDVLFQSKLLNTVDDQAIIALKGKAGIVKVGEIIDRRERVNSGYRIDSGRYPFSIWTLTMQNVPIEQVLYLELDIPGMRLPIRLRPSYHTSDTMVDIAFLNNKAMLTPIELIFANEIMDIVDSLRALREEWCHAVMIYLCDEPWIPEQQEQLNGTSGEPLWNLISTQFNSLFTE